MSSAETKPSRRSPTRPRGAGAGSPYPPDAGMGGARHLAGGFRAGRLPGGWRYELIDGRLEVFATPELPHDLVRNGFRAGCSRTATPIRQVINYVSGCCRVFIPGRREATCPQPDLAAYRDYPFACRAKCGAGTFFNPLLVVEVISEDYRGQGSGPQRDALPAGADAARILDFRPAGRRDHPTLRVYRKRGLAPGSGPSTCPSAARTRRRFCPDSPWSWTRPPDPSPGENPFHARFSEFLRPRPVRGNRVRRAGRGPPPQGTGQGRDRIADRRQPLSQHAQRRRGRNPGHPGRRHALLPVARPAVVPRGRRPQLPARIRDRHWAGKRRRRPPAPRCSSSSSARRFSTPATPFWCSRRTSPPTAPTSTAAAPRRVQPVAAGEPVPARPRRCETLPERYAAGAGHLPELAAQPDRRRGDGR